MTKLHVSFPDLDDDTKLYDLVSNIRNLPPLKPDIKVENVQIACQIGSGKFSDVFLAIVGPDCYALKIFKPYYNRRFDEERNTLLLLTKYSVPNIPRLISTFSIPDSRQKALLMDLMYEHYNIEQIRKLSIEVKLSIIYKILFSLKRANEAGVIHGNICPSNILVDSSLDQFKTLGELDPNHTEFELSRSVNVLIVGWNISVRSQDTKNFQNIKYNKSFINRFVIEKNNTKDIKIYGGNYNFKAPELLAMKNSFSSKVDIWSVGCLFVHFFHDIWKSDGGSSRYPPNIEALLKIAKKIGQEEVLFSCKDYIPDEYKGTFSSINANKEPFKEEFEDIKKSIEVFVNSRLKSISKPEFKFDDNQYWDKNFPQENSLSSGIDTKIKKVYKGIADYITRSICVSENLRFNIQVVLEHLGDISTNLIDLSKSLNALVENLKKQKA